MSLTTPPQHLQQFVRGTSHSEADAKMDDFMRLGHDDFISEMLRIHGANSTRKWRSMIKTKKIGPLTVRICQIC